MELDIYQIDAFAEKQFEGNPAAVVPLQQWFLDKTMQAIAEENNLAETAFFVATKTGFNIRWFTPNKEVNLCGHATLATAYVLFNCLGHASHTVDFNSLSGPLSVSKKDDLLTLNFPSQKPQKCEMPEALIGGLGINPSACYKNQDYIAVYGTHENIQNINPNHSHLKKLDLRGVIVTAPAAEYDFVARFFAPKYAIPEDPVTGSAYTQLTPYWSNRLGKSKLKARQISARGGTVLCEQKVDRVLISGSAVQYMKGKIEIKT